jgi:hypothetical protein
MSSIPCKFNNKCNNKNCRYSHEPTLHRNGEEYRTKNHTFTHVKPPRSATETQHNCKNDVYCSRTDCFFNHPNGRWIDDNTNSVDSSSPRSANFYRQRHDSSQSDTSSTISNTRMRNNCRLGTKCRRSDCYFEHPHGRDIDQVSTNTINTENQQSSNSKLIEMIDKLLSKAEEQQQEFDINDKECSGGDDEQILDVLQQHALNELRAQKNEFQSAINCLTAEFNSILLSAIGNRYDVSRLRRIQQQLERELKRWQSRLPIYAKRSDIIEKLKRNQVFILKADTGSGKSTQIVQYLCDEHFADQSIFLAF